MDVRDGLRGPAVDGSRDTLVAAILDFVAVTDLLSLADIRAALEREIDEAGPEALLALQARLTTDAGWAYYPRDPLAQRIHHLLADRLLQDDSRLFGLEHLAGIVTGPIAMFANHLSYADANLVEILLQRSGGAPLANRLTAIAGPKVFTSRQRRFSSLCFGTVKVPQSADVSTGEAIMSAREVARAARSSIDAARARLAAGDALLVFAEGTRSRTAAMQPMLAGVARYLDVPDTWIAPAGLTGSEALFPVGHDGLTPARIVVRLGHLICADALLACAGRDRRVVMDAVGLAIAELVPPEYRGVYAETGRFPDAMRALDESRQVG